MLLSRQIFDARGDVVATLHYLADNNLVHVASNQLATTITPLFGPVQSASGGKVPICSFASAMGMFLFMQPSR